MPPAARVLVAGLFVCALAAGAVSDAHAAQPPAQNAKPGPAVKLTPQQALDRLFVSHAAMSAIANAQLGQLAVTKAESPAVRRLGQDVVDASRAAMTQLKALAAALGVLLPDKLPRDEQAQIDRLAPLAGKPFDRTVMAEIWSETTRDRSLFQRIANQAGDSGVKTWGAKALEQALQRQTAVKELTLAVVGAPARPSAAGR